MRYTVDPAELTRAADQVRRAALLCRNVSRTLEPLAGGVPKGGSTSDVLSDVVARWRVRERLMDAALGAYAASLAAAATAYCRIEAATAAAMKGSS